MKTYSNAIETYRAGYNRFEAAHYFRILVRDRETGDHRWYNFSTRDENETTAVRDNVTGELEFQDFEGGGVVVGSDPLVRQDGTDVRNLSIVLSGTAQSVKDMVYGYDCRDARIEWHVGEIEGGTGLLVDDPVCEFEGLVDVASLEDSAFDIDDDEPAPSTITLSVVDYHVVLQRSNPDMRSDEVGQRRSGDRIFQHAAANNTWFLPWGKLGRKHKKKGNGGGRDHNDSRDRRQSHGGR